MKKKCILVLSMHRSGSSCCSGSMQFLGTPVSFGAHHSQEKNRWNAKGFFENELILKFNNSALASVGGLWKKVWVWNNAEKATLMTFVPKLKEIIQTDFLSQKEDYFLIKDPRIIWLYPIYEKVLQDLSVETYIVHIDRPDNEVAKSLWDPHRLKYPDALRLTELYKTELQKVLAGKPQDKIVHLTYNELLQSPVTVLQKINRLLGLDPEKVDATNVSKFIDRTLKHF